MYVCIYACGVSLCGCVCMPLLLDKDCALECIEEEQQNVWYF